MKIVAAPQALKGSLDAAAVGQAIVAGIHAVMPTAEVVALPVADGGEGTVAALVAATGGRLVAARVTGPLGEPVVARFGVLTPWPPSRSAASREGGAGAEQAGGAVADGGADAAGEGGGGADRARPMKEWPEDGALTAVIEMAAASGLPLVPPARRDPRFTTTRGTGELIRAALEAGARRILVGIGGSATNDGGAGMAQALGARLLDGDGRELPTGGAALARLERIDAAGLDPRLASAEVIVASDVTNPLCGPLGASAVYGPQKGATPEMVAELDAALAHYADILRRDLGADVAEIPGAGAAGGLGAGLMAFLRARLQPGAAMVLEAVGFEQALAGATLVFTAEGRLDEQTAYGKAVGAVAAAAQRHGVPVVVLAGSLGPGYAALYAHGVSAVVPLPDGPLTLDESMARAAELVAAAAERAMRLIQLETRLPAP
jgi:glycerate 2-kinase